MDRENLNGQVFLELILGISIDASPEEIISKSLPEFVKKLNCFAGAVYLRNGLNFTSPRKYQDASYNDYHQIIRTKLEKLDTSYLNFQEDQKYVYAFKLATYGWLVLKRNNAFFIAAIDEIEKSCHFFGRMIGQSDDREQRKLAEQKLVEERQLLRTVIDNIPINIYVKDTKKRKILANKAEMDFLGAQGEDEVLGMQDDNFFKDEFLNRSLAEDEQVLKEKKPLFNEIRKTSTDRWGIVSKIPLLDDKNMVRGLVGINMDFTEKMQTEEQLIIFQSLMDHSTDAILVMNEDKSLCYANQMAASLLEIPKFGQQNNVNLQHESIDLMLPDWDEHLAALKAKGTLTIEHSIINRANSTPSEVEINNKYIILSGKGFVISNIRDITSRKKSEETLKDTKEKLESIFNEMKDVVWSVSYPDYKLLFISPSAEDLYGLPMSEWTKDTSWWSKFVHPDDAPIIESSYIQLAQKGDYSVDYRIIAVDGTVKWVQNRGRLVYDEAGTPIRIDGVVQDRTAEQKLKLDVQNEVSLQEIILNISSKYINIDLNKVENYIQKSLQELAEFVEADRAYIFEYDFIDETTSNTFEWCAENISPEINNLQKVPMAFFPQWVEQHQKGEAFYIPKIEDLDDDLEGELKAILSAQGIKSLIAIPMIDGNDLIGFVGFDAVRHHYAYSDKESKLLFLYAQMLINVQNRQKRELKLQVQEERFRNIIANMNLGLIEVDLERSIKFANNSFCEMSGHQLDELANKNIDKIFSESGIGTQLIRGEIENENTTSSNEIKITNKDGEQKYWFVSGAPNYNDKGKLMGNVGIFLDITKQKVLENELTLAKIEAENATKARELFLANISHEIRNPINGIIGLSNLLYDTKPTKQQLELLDNIKNASEMLHSLISGILDMSKIENGKLELVEKEVNLVDIVNGLIQLNRFNLDTKPVRIINGLSDLAEPQAVADPLVVNQIFFNLLNNAIKFTHQGSIAISGEILGENEGKIHFSFAIEDTGIGIPSDKHQSIFELFSQSDAETKLVYGGSGLGLSIVKRLVEAYGGQIDVVSDLGTGSKFTFDLYLKRATNSEPKEIAHALAPAAGARVLLVEDNPINLAYLVGLMNRWKVDHDGAENGLRALEHLAKTKYDLILMDIRMPEMDGYETTIRLRNDKSNQNSMIPIVALTASALIDEKERALSAGMNDHITKPFSPETLMDSLRKFHILKSINEHSEILEQLDSSYFATYFNGDGEYAATMMEIFIDNIDIDVDKLKKAYGDQNWAEFIKTAHKIKPSFDMVGLSVISKMMLEFESIDENHIKHGQLMEQFSNFEHTFMKGKQLVSDQLLAFKKS